MAQVRARRINGNVLYYVGHRERIIGGFGPNVKSVRLDATNVNLTANDPVGWTTTVVEVGAGTSEIDANISGRVVITTAANENDGLQTQHDGLWISNDGSAGYCMTVTGQINDVDETDLFFGAGATDTTVLGGVADGVYMESLDGAATVALVAEKDSTETTSTSTGTLTDATDFTLDIFFDGTTLRGYVNGSEIYDAVPANLPDDVGLRPTIAFLTGEAVANTFNFINAVWTQWLV